MLSHAAAQHAASHPPGSSTFNHVHNLPAKHGLRVCPSNGLFDISDIVFSSWKYHFSNVSDDLKNSLYPSATETEPEEEEVRRAKYSGKGMDRITFIENCMKERFSENAAAVVQCLDRVFFPVEVRLKSADPKVKLEEAKLAEISHPDSEVLCAAKVLKNVSFKSENTAIGVMKEVNHIVTSCYSDAVATFKRKAKLKRIADKKKKKVKEAGGVPDSAKKIMEGGGPGGAKKNNSLTKMRGNALNLSPVMSRHVNFKSSAVYKKYKPALKKKQDFADYIDPPSDFEEHKSDSDSDFYDDELDLSDDEHNSKPPEESDEDEEENLSDDSRSFESSDDDIIDDTNSESTLEKSGGKKKSELEKHQNKALRAKKHTSFNHLDEEIRKYFLKRDHDLDIEDSLMTRKEVDLTKMMRFDHNKIQLNGRKRTTKAAPPLSGIAGIDAIPYLKTTLVGRLKSDNTQVVLFTHEKQNFEWVKDYITEEPEEYEKQLEELSQTTSPSSAKTLDRKHSHGNLKRENSTVGAPEPVQINNYPHYVQTVGKVDRGRVVGTKLPFKTIGCCPLQDFVSYNSIYEQNLKRQELKEVHDEDTVNQKPDKKDKDHKEHAQKDHKHHKRHVVLPQEAAFHDTNNIPTYFPSGKDLPVPPAPLTVYFEGPYVRPAFDVDYELNVDGGALEEGTCVRFFHADR